MIRVHEEWNNFIRDQSERTDNEALNEHLAFDAERVQNS